ncbi:metal-sulfur cluster assembly factor [Euzebya sp.]|uniref:metal-sulfur cluster assembly factor n=1 Tax=Euzebya sp. TaxID=1971409 RepID=UPI00351355B1
METTAPVELTTEQVEVRLHSVIDPEVGIGIVDLGLVYGIDVDDAAVVVTMTMTTPACPLGAYLERSVEHAVADLAGPRLIQVDLVFDPPGSPERISPAGRVALGWA